MRKASQQRTSASVIQYIESQDFDLTWNLYTRSDWIVKIPQTQESFFITADNDQDGIALALKQLDSESSHI